jgi:hypothetical protein
MLARRKTRVCNFLDRSFFGLTVRKSVNRLANTVVGLARPMIYAELRGKFFAAQDRMIVA